MKIKNKVIISLTLSTLVVFMGSSSALATESDWQNLTPAINLESGLSGTVNNCSPLTVAHGSVAAYPACTITCSSGYTKSGNSCISSPPAAGGTGGSSGGYTYPAGCTSAVGYSTTTGLSCSGTTTTTTTATSTIVTVGGSTFILPILPANPTNEELSNQVSILLQIVATLKAQLALITGGGGEAQGVPLLFTRNLSFGMTGEDVHQLQIYLNTHGFAVSSSGPGSSGNETTYFGNATKAALIKFQKASGISPASGYFGPLTRAYVNSHP